MEQDPDSPPTIWFQPPIATAPRRRVPPIDPVVLIILFPILVLLFLFFFLPPFLSHTSHILKPASVKSTWDSLNIFLVLFAILCGVLARKNDDVSSSGEGSGFVADTTDSAQSSGQWIGYLNQKSVSGGLRRSSSSYPNLRPQSEWENGENQNRYFDDFDVDMSLSPVSRYYNNLSRRMERERGNYYQSTPVSDDIHRQSRKSDADRVEFGDVKEIVVDTFEVSPNVSEIRQQSRVPTTPPPPPPPPPRPALSINSQSHSFRSVGKNVNTEAASKIESDELEKVRSYPPPSPPPPPPPPPPPLSSAKGMRVHRSRHKHKKLERKVSDATKEIATAITSLYNQRKTKNKRKLRNISSSSDSSPPSVHSTRSPETEEPRQTLAPPPPPPLPPPPPSMFQNLFKKGGKHKRIHSVPATTSPTVPPPPPPPPPSSIFNNICKSGGKNKRFYLPSNAPPPPPPLPPSSIMNTLFKNATKSKRFNSITATSSPPTPPPLPPPMTPPRYTIPVKSKQLSKRTNQAQPPSPSPPSPPKSEPCNRRSTSKGKPPLPTKESSYFDRDDFLPSGSQSPLIPMPPPPPPPFSVPAMKFELRGDFVRVRSTHSSVSSSPDREAGDLSSTIMYGGDSNGPGSGNGSIFFPSPDVNAKADSFISRLKNEWRMEKISYVNEKLG